MVVAIPAVSPRAAMIGGAQQAAQAAAPNPPRSAASFGFTFRGVCGGGDGLQPQAESGDVAHDWSTSQAVSSGIGGLGVVVISLLGACRHAVGDAR